MKIVITGPPKSGKTTLGVALAKVLGIDVFHTDSLRKLEWSEASQEASFWFDRDRYIIEGVVVPRALRKWRERNPNAEAPFDKFIYFTTPWKPLELPGQRSMTRQIEKISEELRPWIGDRWINL